MQIGISPKVRNPTLLLLAVGLALVLLGALLDEDEARTLGYGALGSAVATLAAGYVSGPGEVIVEQGPPSDALLNDVELDEPEARA